MGIEWLASEKGRRAIDRVDRCQIPNSLSLQFAFIALATSPGACLSKRPALNWPGGCHDIMDCRHMHG